MVVNLKDTIVALSTPEGSGAIAVIRLSGEKTFEILAPFSKVDFSKKDSHSAHFTLFKNGDEIIDECVITIFKGPNSYTAQDIAEISCHASSYIIQRILDSLLKNGARLASPGEFTQRAYLNGKLDLSQAEAVGDLIASSTEHQHKIALHQLKGGVSNKVKELRGNLIEFASLIELENDFGEEDVEFADRNALSNQVNEVIDLIDSLASSFEYGNAIKKGIPVAIIGKPNVGKSTLLNELLQEEKAIVSDIPGTTRDVIEDSVQIDGYLYRFVDTAGIRETDDVVETLGIERTFDQIKKAQIVLFLSEFNEDFEDIVRDFKQIEFQPNQKRIILLNKVDLYDHTCHSYDVEESVSTLTGRTKTILLSAKNGQGIDELKKELVTTVSNLKGAGQDLIISNMRHMSVLQNTKSSLLDVREGINSGIPSDLIAIDLRRAMNYLGEISGEISTDDLLESIFSNFCIGK